MKVNFTTSARNLLNLFRMKFNAIKEVATEGNYGFIFDKASGMSIIYSDPKYDVSDEIVKKLGY